METCKEQKAQNNFSFFSVHFIVHIRQKNKQFHISLSFNCGSVSIGHYRILKRTKRKLFKCDIKSVPTRIQKNTQHTTQQKYSADQSLFRRDNHQRHIELIINNLCKSKEI